jgi:hypothetical protein
MPAAIAIERKEARVRVRGVILGVPFQPECKDHTDMKYAYGAIDPADVPSSYQ